MHMSFHEFFGSGHLITVGYLAVIGGDYCREFMVLPRHGVFLFCVVVTP